MTCKDCIHYFACSAHGGLFNEKDETKEMLCGKFENKTDFVKVIRCKDCKYLEDVEWCAIHGHKIEHDEFCSYGTKADPERDAILKKHTINDLRAVLDLPPIEDGAEWVTK